MEQLIPWEAMATANEGRLLVELCEEQPVLLVFLRHFGCSFCREAINDIAKRRKKIEARGFRIVLVHMAAEPGIAEKYFKRYKLFPIDHVADPERRFYRAFGLSRGTPQQLFGFISWMRGFQAGVIEGHGFGYQSEDIGDGFQMPGVFVIHHGKILNSFIHHFQFDRPDYEQIVDCCTI